MPDAEPSLGEYLDEHPLRVVIVGGGVGGLVAARELARPGFQVTVVEASPAVGGSVATVEVAGVPLDAGAESFATRGGHVAALIHELHLDDQLVTPNPAGAWLQLPGRAVPTPKGGMLGIPSSPLASDVVAAIGWRGALRAYLDRVIPVLKIGQEHDLERLVLRRMGRRVLEDLVAPVTTGVYSAAPSQLDVSIAAPGLNSALTRTGSLSGAVAELREGAAKKAGSAVGGLRGGVARLVDALAHELRLRDATILTGLAVTAVARISPTDGAAQRPAGEEGGSAPGQPEEPAAPLFAVTLSDETVLEADAVLFAAPSAGALPLLAGLSPELAAAAALDWPDATSVELVTLVLDAPALDAAPRGTGLLVSDRVDPETIMAKALTHVTAKWPWVAELLPPGRHVVRLSYGRAGQAGLSFAMGDAELRARAVRDASALLDIPLQESTVVGFARVRWSNAQPLAGSGQRERLAVLAAAVEGTEGIEATGSWVAGTGLASVIPHAKEAAARLRGLRWKSLTD